VSLLSLLSPAARVFSAASRVNLVSSQLGSDHIRREAETEASSAQDSASQAAAAAAASCSQ